MAKITPEIEELFRKVRTLLGAPIRRVELTDEALCNLLDVVVEDYAERVQSFLGQNYWGCGCGKHVITTGFAFA